MIKKILEYSRFPLTPLNINTMKGYSKPLHKNTLLNIAKFMYNEIPIRLSKCYYELSQLPFTPYVNSVSKLYENSFDDITSQYYPKTYDDCVLLSNTLLNIKDRHNKVQLNLSKGIQQWKSENKYIDYNINHFLDKFYMSRIGIRTIMGQYIGLVRDNENIIKDCYPKKILDTALYDAINICEMTYGDSPDIIVNGNDDFHFVYIPSHLYYIIFELCKNSLRATMELAEINHTKPNNIHIYISEGKEDLIVKISDKGGGFPRNKINDVFQYSYTTVENDLIPTNQPCIAGFGYGLPLSKLYANYFHGDLMIIPSEGIGADALVFINRLGDKAEMI